MFQIIDDEADIHSVLVKNLRECRYTSQLFLCFMMFHDVL